MDLRPLAAAAIAVCSLCSVTATLQSGANAAVRHLKVIVLAGQSNAEGYESYAVQSDGSNLLGTNPADNSVPFTFWGDDTSTVDTPPAFLNAPQVIAQTGKQTFGPEIGIARFLWSHHRQNIAVVKVAVAGSSLASWEPGSARLMTLSKQVTDLETWESDQGTSASVTAIVWMQGETESLGATAPATYRATLSSFLPKLRHAVGAKATVPVILVRTSTAAYVGILRRVTKGNCTPSSCADLLEWNVMVRAAQLSVAKSSARVILVDSAGLPRTGVQLHLSATGELLLGKKVGKALSTRM